MTPGTSSTKLAPPAAKRLILVRHAKAAPHGSTEEDIDRPLDERGKSDANAMAAWLKGAGASPDHIASSPAKRAFRTAQAFAEAFDAKAITVDPRIYEADPSTLLDLVRGMPDRFPTCMLVGHNPGITELALWLSESPLDELPTCAAVCLDFDARSWNSLKPSSGKLRLAMAPAGLPPSRN